MDKDIKFQLQILSIKFFIYEECNIHVVDSKYCILKKFYRRKEHQIINYNLGM